MARVNRAIELLEQGQPVYYIGLEKDGFVDGVKEYSFAGGVKVADTWADIILVIMEHEPFDVVALRQFMLGLAQGGPTRSGHRTPTVIVELPVSGTDEAVVRANAWMINQVLATGVHGLLLCHANTPAAIRAYVESARYPFQGIGVGKGLDEGRRGSGGQGPASQIWGLSADEYLRRADVWPLNPQGELLLGIKIENRHGLANTEENVQVPGVSFAEWAPLDMSLSLGLLGQHLPPYPAEMEESRLRLLAACKAAKAAFCFQVFPETVADSIDEGLMVGVAFVKDAAEAGRKHTGRRMLW